MREPNETRAMNIAITSDRSPPPAWEKVPFDVGCARCGHDLRDRTDPTCPACELTFDWADAVPIERLTCAQCGYHLYGLTETRCPECGSPFTWDEALTAYHRSRLPLFEYQWRKRPVRSLLTTWRRALRPGKFWRSVDIHDPVRRLPLIIVFAAAMFLISIVQPVVDGVIAWSIDFQFFPFLGSKRKGLLAEIADSALDLDTYVNVLLPMASWCIFSFAALLVFQQSMRRYRVRTAHVLRVWAYSVALMVGLLYLVTSGTVLLLITTDWYFLGWVTYLAVLSVIAFVVWSIRQGYCHYLHMPHSLGVAFASQFIAVAATLTLLTVIGGP